MPLDTKEYYQKYYQEHKQEYLNRAKNKPKNPDKIREYQRNCRKNQKLRILKALGGKCAKCGFSDIRALQIDHINGKGTQEIHSFQTRWQYYRFILKEVESGSKNYQLLCANCNWIKRYENNEI